MIEREIYSASGEQSDIYLEVNYKKFFQWLIFLYKKSISQHKIATIIWLLLSILTALVSPLLIYYNVQIVDAVALISSNNESLFDTFMIVIKIGGLRLLVVIFNLITTHQYDKIKQLASFEVQTLFYLKLCKIELDFFENNIFLRRLRKANEAIFQDGFSVLRDIVNAFMNVIEIIGVGIVLFLVHWSLPVAMILGTLPQLLIILMFKKKQFDLEWSNATTVNEMTYTSGLFSDRNAQKEIKTFGLSKPLIDRWSRLFDKYRLQQLTLQRKEAQTRALGATLMQIITILSSFFLIYMVAYDSLNVGAYVALTTAILSIQKSLESFWGNVGNISEMKLKMSQLMHILTDYSTDEIEGRLEFDAIRRLDLKSIYYKYPGTSNYALKNINLSIKKGDKIAIVGENGSGKTTLIHILLGLYTDFKGSMSVNDVIINKHNVDAYRKRISAILQNYMRYIFSIYDNVCIGAGELIDDVIESDVEKLLKLVGLEDKINQLEMGVHTHLDKMYDYGVELSGGQWQRLGIARSLMKESDLVILDEPTAALDPVSEVELFNLFSALTEDKTVVMISHRLGITKFADKIIFMDKGSIIASGCHENLMETCKKYREMFENQAQWYK